LVQGLKADYTNIVRTKATWEKKQFEDEILAQLKKCTGQNFGPDPAP
jgi:hypothetical protein